MNVSFSEKKSKIEFGEKMSWQKNKKTHKLKKIIKYKKIQKDAFAQITQSAKRFNSFMGRQNVSDIDSEKTKMYIKQISVAKKHTKKPQTHAQKLPLCTLP